MKKTLIAGAAIVALCSSTAAFAKGSYVKLYEDKGFVGRSVTAGLKKSIPDMHADGLNDKVSSVKYNIPSGWQVVLHADTGYRGTTYVLEGSGSVADLGNFEDKCSSLEWVRR